MSQGVEGQGGSGYLILTVTLNAAVDKTYRVEDFALDRVNRPSEVRVVAGGKGINVARVYQALGGRAVATGFLGGYNGRIVSRSLKREGITAEFVRTRDESRVCIAAVDPVNHTQTEINESGPAVTPQEVEALISGVKRLLSDHRFRFIVLSGSLPPGVPEGIYADLIDLAAESGVRSVLDASGDALKLGATRKPWMIKPNAFELATLVGRDTSYPGEVAEACNPILGTGVAVLGVTLGRKGAVCCTNEGAWASTAPEISFISAVGSGDSWLAAFLWALEEGLGFSEATRLATGAGTANAAVYGAGFITKREIFDCAERVQVTSLT